MTDEEDAVTDEETVQWLVQEVEDLLDVSSVGLYEFIELLNTPHRALPIEQKELLARQALERIARKDRVVLRWLTWPKSDNHGDVSLDALPPDAWRSPGADGRYVAVDRPAEA